MNVIKRSILYVTRKCGKSLLLFCILLIVSTLVLCGLASLDAEEETSAELRGTTGTSFTVERNLSSGSWSSENSENSYSTQEFISVEMARKIAEIDGIEAYDATYTTIFEFFDENGKYIENVNPTGQSMVDGQYYTIGTVCSEYSSAFLSGAFTLVDGRHITQSDRYAVLISKELADKHKLQIGDSINTTDGLTDLWAEFEIVGIFDVLADKTDEKNNYNMASYYDYENYAYMDMTGMSEMLKNYSDGPSYGYTSADFFVSDPEQLEQLILEVQAIDDITWDNFTITANDEVYERTESSMTGMSSLIRTLIVVTVIISMGIITLILSIWVKSRVRETGILLAIGVSKLSILLQHILEVIVIAAFSFPASYGVSRIVVEHIGSLLGKSGDIAVTTAHFVIVCAAEILLLLLACVISCIPTMRLKPREILSKMS